jgi:hypothetical protein
MSFSSLYSNKLRDTGSVTVAAIFWDFYTNVYLGTFATCVVNKVLLYNIGPVELVQSDKAFVACHSGLDLYSWTFVKNFELY